MKKKSGLFDTTLILLSLLYITIPIIIFSYYWFNIYIFIIAASLFTYSIINIYKSLDKTSTILINKQNIVFFIVSFIIISLWIYFSGIGGYSFQNNDFWVRNTVYRDLCIREWPLIYDLSENTEIVSSLIGNDKVLFVYYLTFYLLPAWISKIFLLKENASELLLYLYSVTGVFLSFYLICRILKKCLYRYLIIFIFFSGMDFLEYIIMNGRLPEMFKHLEWSSVLFQYTGNTSLLYWVYNQAIPMWILICLFLLVSEEYCLGIGSIMFAYSPLSLLGLIPFMLVKVFRGYKKNIYSYFIKICTPENIIIPFFMIMTYGTYYSLIQTRLSFSFYPALISSNNISPLIFLICYTVFIITEFLLYYLIIYKELKRIQLNNNIHYYIHLVLVMLLLTPFIYCYKNNFVMRFSCPTLFILMLFIMIFYTYSDNRKLKGYLTIFLVIGSISPLFEIGRGISAKNPGKGFTSFDYMDKAFIPYKMEEQEDKLLKEYIITIDEQFFSHDYYNSLYWRIKND